MTRPLRLLVVADNADGWPVDEHGRWLLDQLVAETAPEAVVSLGDYQSVHARALTAAGAPVVFGVYGNHCTSDYMPAAGMIDLIGDRSLPARLGALHMPDGTDLRILAVQGCVRYKPDVDDVLFTQEEYAAALDDLPGADLVITHCPPAGINDAPDPAHVGISALRGWVDRHQPRWLLHGHTYENPARSSHGRTDVIYVSGWSVVELDLSSL